MALFRRKTTDSVLPEVDKYYEGERRDRAGLAWLLALVSVAVVALVLIGTFLAGRWAYRQITANDDQVAVTETTEEVPSFDGGQEAAPAENEDEESSAGDEQTDGTVNAPAQTNTPSTPVASSDAPLPSTGPADTAVIFLTVSAVAGGVHYLVSRKRAAELI